MTKRLITLLVTGLLSTSLLAQEVNVYSARKEALIKPILEQFTDKTGIKVNLITGKADALISRMQNEGKHSPADLLVTTDVGRLYRAKTQDLLQAVDSKVLSDNIPAHLRDPQQHWYALTLRARPIMYAKDRVAADELSTLQDLTDAKWKGRICIRSSSNIYNQSLIASMIEIQGEQKTQQWANDFVKNFARPPKGGDRDQIKAVAAGQCDIAVANTYYLAGMLADADSSNGKAAAKVKVFWPDQQGSGAHINISGAGVAKHAPNAEAAKKLMEFMITEQAQAWYAKTNGEYPVRAGVSWSPILEGFGQFKPQQISLEKVGERNAQALKLMDKANWK